MTCTTGIVYCYFYVCATKHRMCNNSNNCWHVATNPVSMYIVAEVIVGLAFHSVNMFENIVDRDKHLR